MNPGPALLLTFPFPGCGCLLWQDIYGGSRLDALFRCSLLSKAAIEAVRGAVEHGTALRGTKICVFDLMLPRKRAW